MELEERADLGLSEHRTPNKTSNMSAAPLQAPRMFILLPQNVDLEGSSVMAQAGAGPGGSWTPPGCTKPLVSWQKLQCLWAMSHSTQFTDSLHHQGWGLSSPGGTAPSVTGNGKSGGNKIIKIMSFSASIPGCKSHFFHQATRGRHIKPPTTHPDKQSPDGTGERQRKPRCMCTLYNLGKTFRYQGSQLWYIRQMCIWTSLQNCWYTTAFNLC